MAQKTGLRIPLEKDPLENGVFDGFLGFQYPTHFSLAYMQPFLVSII
jgi:hypothetical protein